MNTQSISVNETPETVIWRQREKCLEELRKKVKKKWHPLVISISALNAGMYPEGKKQRLKELA